MLTFEKIVPCKIKLSAGCSGVDAYLLDFIS